MYDAMDVYKIMCRDEPTLCRPFNLMPLYDSVRLPRNPQTDLLRLPPP